MVLTSAKTTTRLGKGEAIRVLCPIDRCGFAAIVTFSTLLSRLALSPRTSYQGEEVVERSNESEAVEARMTAANVQHNTHCRCTQQARRPDLRCSETLQQREQSDLRSDMVMRIPRQIHHFRIGFEDPNLVSSRPEEPCDLLS